MEKAENKMKAASHGLLIKIIFMALVTAFFSATMAFATDISACSNLNIANTVYNLTQNISSSGTCMNITANNITLDCHGFTINYSQSATGYGITNNFSAFYGYNHTTIKNCNIIKTSGISSSAGIWLGGSNGTILNNSIITFSANGNGIYLSYSYYDNISFNGIYTNEANSPGIMFSFSSNNNISFNNISTNGSTGYGIYIAAAAGSNNISFNNIYTNGSTAPGIQSDGATLNNIYSNNISTNGSSSDGIFFHTTASNNISSNIISTNGTNSEGIHLEYDSDNNIISNSTIKSTKSYAIYLLNDTSGGPNGNRIYNNLLNGSSYPINGTSDWYNHQNYWNTSNQTGTKIYSNGTRIGGNYYTNSTGNGFSDTCIDANYDGFCDSSYNVSTDVTCSGATCGNNTDYFAYSSTGNISDWTFRRVINISNIAENLTNYQVMVNINMTSEYSSGQISSTCKDLRFLNSSGSNLYFWVESCNLSSSNLTVWVNVTSIINNTNTTIYMYHGNPNAANASNGSLTFDFFDDFPGAALDTNKWTGGTGSVSDSVLTAVKDNDIKSNTERWTAGSIARARYKVGADQWAWYSGFYNGIESNDIYAYNEGAARWRSYPTDVNRTINFTSYHVVELRFPGGSIKPSFWVDNVKDADSNVTVSSATHPYQIHAHNQTIYVDWVLKRKYASTEPTLSFGSKESLISSCANLNSVNTVYNLTQNVSSAGTCMNITANNITLDCHGFTINYSQSSAGYAINNSDGYNMTTIKNCVIIHTNSSLSNSYGLYFNSASNGNITNNSINTSGSNSYGIYIYQNSDNNTISNSSIKSINSYAVYLSNTTSKPENNIFYNNLLNGSAIAVGFAAGFDANILNYWNTSNQTGNRTYSNGTMIGGNYYTNSIGRGFSDTCTDSNHDVFCDLQYNVITNAACNSTLGQCGNNTDYLPMGKDSVAPTISTISVNSTYIKINWSVMFRAMVGDIGEGVSTVKFNIQTPYGNLNLTAVSDYSTWFYVLCNSTNACNTTIAGQYNLTSVWANDTANNIVTDNLPLKNFTVLESMPQYIIVDKGTDSYSMRFDENKIVYAYAGNKNVTGNVSSGWHHIAMTYDGNNLNIFIDGQFINSTPVSGISSNSNNIYIGGSLLAATTMNGKVDEVKIYNTSLSQAEIHDDYIKGTKGVVIVQT